MKKMFCLILMIAGILLLTVPPVSADCPSWRAGCLKFPHGIGMVREVVFGGYITVGSCWKEWGCQNCKSNKELIEECSITYPATCGGNSCVICSSVTRTGDVVSYFSCEDSQGNSW